MKSHDRLCSERLRHMVIHSLSIILLNLDSSLLVIVVTWRSHLTRQLFSNYCQIFFFFFFVILVGSFTFWLTFWSSRKSHQELTRYKRKSLIATRFLNKMLSQIFEPPLLMQGITFALVLLGFQTLHLNYYLYII